MPTSIASCRDLIRLGYNSNGLAHHDLFQAIDLLADVGYKSMALTLDHGPLNPYSSDWQVCLRRISQHLTRREMGCVIETGARYLLDPRQKHEPTMMSKELDARRVREEFLRHAIEAAKELNADAVSIWSGVLRDRIDDETAFGRLVDGLHRTLDFAGERNVVVAFEPEPGMFIDTMTRFRQLTARLRRPELRLTLDVGHLHCLGETPLANQIRTWGPLLANIHIEDMRYGVHEHLMFGEGEIEFPPVIDALLEVGYQGGLHVELSRHSHDAPRIVQAAYEFLRPLLAAACEGIEHD